MASKCIRTTSASECLQAENSKKQENIRGNCLVLFLLPMPMEASALETVKY